MTGREVDSVIVMRKRGGWQVATYYVGNKGDHPDAIGGSPRPEDVLVLVARSLGLTASDLLRASQHPDAPGALPPECDEGEFPEPPL